jgi:spectinomycin phosphotransferase
MLEKPDLPDEKILACLRGDYGLRAARIAFLPLGNDMNTAVYRVDADDATPYFLKLRSGVFDEATVAIPHFLRDQGIAQIIAPIETHAGRLWADVDGFAAILYPFVAGHNGFEVDLSDHHWIELGVALKGIHTASVPHSIARHIPREIYSPRWRDMARAFQADAETTAYADPVAAEFGAFLRSKRETIGDLIARAERFGDALRARSLEQVLCHADIHAGNVLIGADDALSIVDWDTLTFAPKEHDLMFIGAGIGDDIWHDPREEALFYQGYGETEIDPMALAYYRYERIVQDIAAYGEQLLLSDEGGADREQGLRFFVSQFLPNNVVEIAYASDRTRTE